LAKVPFAVLAGEVRLDQPSPAHLKKETMTMAMPTITDRNLDIVLGLPANRVRVTVTCNVNFTETQRNRMRDGLVRYRLKCKLWEADNGQNALIDADNVLFRFGEQHTFPLPEWNGNPPATYSATFREDKSQNDLDDEGTEEIYGELTLRNLDENESPKKKRTNEVHHNFG
jgi:hypothetical protein